MKTTVQLESVDPETGEVTRGEPFDLEPDPPAGKVPQRVLDELANCRRIATDYAQSYSDAVKQQAERFKIKPGALKRYVNALVADKVDELDAETDDLERLLDEDSA